VNILDFYPLFIVVFRIKSNSKYKTDEATKEDLQAALKILNGLAHNSGVYGYVCTCLANVTFVDN